MKNYLVLLALSMAVSVNAQSELHQYKYILMPYQFDFAKKPDQYRLNTLTRYKLKQMGFDVYFDNETLPADVASDRCLAAFADVVNSSGFLTTKLTVVFKDCQNTVIYSTKEGSSKTKEYDKAYKEALNEAFISLSGFKYSYKPKKQTKTSTSGVTPAVATTATVAAATQTTPMTNTSPATTVPPPPPPPTNSATKEVATTTAVVTTAAAASQSPSGTTTQQEILYAQPTANGYQLVDSTPKIVYVLQKTQHPDIYIVKGKDGVVYKKDGRWSMDEYINGKLQSKVMNIKFFD